MKTFISLLLILLFSATFLIAQPTHPRIYVTENQRAVFQVRLKEYEKIRESVDAMKSKVDPYVERHHSDPQWIVSRLQMYWKTKYKRVYVNGMYFSHGEGQAPVPTVRFSGSRDWATDYIVPKIEDIQPYMDDERGIYLQNDKKPGKPWEWVVPAKTGNIIERMNESILDLAEKAAFIYWLTQEEKYAVFASDILMKYLEGIYYRDAPLTVENHGNANLMGLQTFEVIHERVIEPITIGYDFIYPYLAKKGKDIKMIAEVFRRWADQEIKNGVPDNNWNLMQARYITYLALALDDDKTYSDGKGQQYYIDQILNKNSIRQKALKDVAKTFDQQTGIWPETSGYSTGVSKDILEVCCLIDNVSNDHILNQFPIVEKAILATSEYLFPNDFTVAFGDSHHSRIKMGALEMLVSQYRKYGDTVKEAQVTRLLKKFISRKEYNRDEQLSLFQLFFCVDELKAADITTDSGENLITNLFYAPNVSWIVQRNGLDRQNGMMISENASLGNHSHTNGINIELYGKGLVFAPDCAAGVSYWSADHKEYYSRFPAHNTVVVDGKSDYGNMRGGLPFELISNYPESSLPGELCGNVTFTNVSITEPKTDAGQLRLLSIVRTGKTTGYFVDIFRSHRKDGKDIKNEYLYHSQGHQLTIRDVKGIPLKLSPTEELSSAAGDLIGYDYFKDKQTITTAQPTLSKFAIQLGKGEDVGVNLWMNGSQGRKLFSVKAPESRAVSGSVPDTLLGKPLPTLIVRQEGEAWKRPFVAIIEPFYEKDAPSVTKVSWFGSGDSFTGVEVISKGGLKNQIFSGDGEQTQYESTSLKFEGRYGVIGEANNLLTSVLLGDGRLIQTGDWKIENSESKNPVSITILKGQLQISSQKSFRLTIPVPQSKVENIVLKTTSDVAPAQYKGIISQSKYGKIAVFELPALKNQTLIIEQGIK
ncbi:MAG: hypothetical protein NTY07_07545 [Bacteroidia bacterium]|nr:hypothetical protein [Bacteroidia bacterium]